MAEEVRTLRAAAERAFAAGRHQQALANSIRLERADPEDPAWPRYTALVCQAMGRTLDQIDALERAARRHAARGEVVRAVALCKHILALEPEHPAARKLLSGLGTARAPSDRPTGSGAWPPVDPRGWARPEGSGLRAIPLRDVVPGARPAAEEDRPGVHAIPVVGTPIDPGLHPLASLETARPPSDVPPASESVEDRAVAAVAEELRAVARTQQALTDTTLFRDMPEAAFQSLIDRSRMVHLKRDQTIFRQGEQGDTLFVIAEGEVGVIDEGPPRRGLSRLGEGDFFGEMALLGGAPRNATCTALTDVELIALDHDLMEAILHEHPEVLSVLLRFFRDRSIERLLSNSPMFRTLSDRDRELIRPHFRFLEVEPGGTLIVQGKRPDALIMVLAGRADVVREENGKKRRLGTLKPAQIAGEMSLITGQPAMASIQAQEKVLAVDFPAVAFRKIVERRPEVRAYVERVMKRRRETSGVSVPASE